MDIITKIKMKVKVQEEKDCTATMGKCAEATSFELKQAYVFYHGDFSGKTSGELT
jgi:hypothetical protein